ncbi:MAG: putative rane protein [Bacteroidetes bacterium]|jgi:type IX secretion system PorP/SprF family membrane protein|nr:putative rane protein [Bacteroidota bacterium]
MKKYLLSLAFILSITVMCAQDMHFSQFYASPMYLNPAFTGSNACSRVTMVYRNQWPGIKKAYNSYLLSADHYLSKYNMGVGMLLANDVAGSGSLRTTQINPMVAYEAKFSREFGMRFGLQPGVTMKSVDYSKLMFGDQIAQGGPGSTVATVESQKPNTVFFDMGAGVLAYTSKYWGGVSFYNLTQPNQSLMDNDDVLLPLRYTVHGGGKFVLNPNEKDDHLFKSITAAFHYRGQKKFDQFDIGFYYMQSVFTMGVWYRGLPIKHYKEGYPNSDAVVFILGAKADRMYIGYSYDLTVSQLAGRSNGAHEFNISYQFCKPKKKKRRIEVACPKF